MGDLNIMNLGKEQFKQLRDFRQLDEVEPDRYLRYIEEILSN